MAKRKKITVAPELLVWARETAGYKTPAAFLEELSAAPQKRLDCLPKWERGQDQPTLPQLKFLARQYLRPWTLFLLKEPPQEDSTPPQDFRPAASQNNGGGSAPAFSPNLCYQLRRAREHRETALDLLGALAETPPSVNLNTEFRTDPEREGERLRTVLKAPASAFASPGQAFHSWCTLVENSGVLVFHTTRFHRCGPDVQKMSAAALFYEQLPLILLNHKDPPERRVFSLLHGLAHLMRRESGLCMHAANGNGFCLHAEAEDGEKFCNDVAAAALVPWAYLLREVLVQQNWNGREWSGAEMRELARPYGVSPEVMRGRLADLKRIQNSDPQRFRDQNGQPSLERLYQKKAKHSCGAAEGVGRQIPLEKLREFGRPLIRWILQAYWEKEITLRDVAGILRINLKHLDRIEELAFTEEF